MTTILRQVDFFRDDSGRGGSRNGREWRTNNPNTDVLKRPTGWIVYQCAGSSGPFHMYVAIDDAGHWQRIGAGTGTLG